MILALGFYAAGLIRNLLQYTKKDKIGLVMWRVHHKTLFKFDKCIVYTH